VNSEKVTGMQETGLKFIGEANTTLIHSSLLLLQLLNRLAAPQLRRGKRD